MSGVAVLVRQRAQQARRPFGLRRMTKAEHAELMRGMAASLHAYAEVPGCRQSALECLDRADILEQHPRAGWYPKRPRTWRP